VLPHTWLGAGNAVLAAYLAGESQARIISGILGVDMLSKAGQMTPIGGLQSAGLVVDNKCRRYDNVKLQQLSNRSHLGFAQTLRVLLSFPVTSVASAVSVAKAAAVDPC